MMQFLMVMLLSLPLLAQVSPLVPFSSMNVREMVAPAAPAASGAALRDIAPAAVPGRATYGWSIAALVAANALDVASSWHGREINPVVGGSAGQFGVVGHYAQVLLFGNNPFPQYVPARVEFSHVLV